MGSFTFLWILDKIDNRLVCSQSKTSNIVYFEAAHTLQGNVDTVILIHFYNDEITDNSLNECVCMCVHVDIFKNVAEQTVI